MSTFEPANASVWGWGFALELVDIDQVRGPYPTVELKRPIKVALPDAELLPTVRPANQTSWKARQLQDGSIRIASIDRESSRHQKP